MQVLVVKPISNKIIIIQIIQKWPSEINKKKTLQKYKCLFSHRQILPSTPKTVLRVEAGELPLWVCQKQLVANYRVNLREHGDRNPLKIVLYMLEGEDTKMETKLKNCGYSYIYPEQQNV